MGTFLSLPCLCHLLTTPQAALETGGKLSDKDAIALVTTNLEKLLGIKEPNTDLIATTGGTLLDFESKVVAVISPKRGLVDIL